MHSNQGGPLSGIKVLDMGRVMAAPFATQMLADLGAEVVKIERPVRGDEMRHYRPPEVFDKTGELTNESVYFLAANRGKKSITVDFTKPEGRDLILALARTSDIFMENFKVGDLVRYGLDYAGVTAAAPEIIYCSITGFGQTGPYARLPGVDGVFQAMSGLMSVTGEPDGPAQKVGLVIIDIITGLYAAIGILASLRNREVKGGTGQHVDIALLDSAVAAMSHRAMEYLVTGATPQRIGSGTQGSVPSQMFSCSDGELHVAAGADPRFERLCAILGVPDLFDDPRFRQRGDRVRNKKALTEILAPLFMTNTVAHWFERLSQAGVMCSPLYNLKQVFGDDQVKHRRLRREVEHPTLGPLSMVANPIGLSATPIEDYRPPPTLGQHTEEVLRERLGLTDAEIDHLRTVGAI
ncbi:MAG: acyl-CoA transferase/carnitine dehydratase [Caulobacter sp.]|nr:acyl-CoA transferase/carnitine dehydratase [Caulobacter sp.]